MALFIVYLMLFFSPTSIKESVVFAIMSDLCFIIWCLAEEKIYRLLGFVFAQIFYLLIFFVNFGWGVGVCAALIYLVIFLINLNLFRFFQRKN